MKYLIIAELKLIELIGLEDTQCVCHPDLMMAASFPEAPPQL